MKDKEVKLIKKALGKDFFDELNKSEISGGIMKLNTNTAIDPSEIKIALQIVPRYILSYLFINLKDKEVGAVVDLDLPFADAQLHVNKLSLDNYSGQIIKNGKKLVEFKYRSLPGVGLMVMSSLELCDINQLDRIKPTDYNSEKAEKLQDMIDERLKLHDLIQNVVDKKMMEKEAIKQMFRDRLTRGLFHIPRFEGSNVRVQTREEPMEQDKKSKLKQFLDERERRHQPSEIQLGKKEIQCPDCGQVLYKGGDRVDLCICFGEFFGKSLKIQKKESGSVNIKFPKKFGGENIEMLLSALKNKECDN